MKKEEHTISIIGTGDMAKALGLRLASGGASITFYNRELGKARAVASEVSALLKKDASIQGKQVGETLEGEIVIPAVPYLAIFELIEEYAEELAGRTLIEISNPIASFDTLELLTDSTSSAAENIKAKVSPDTKVVKAFNTVFAGVMGNLERREVSPDVFIASDNAEAKKIVADLARQCNLRPIDVGMLIKARTLEGMQAMHMGVQEQLGTNWMSTIKII